MSLRETLSNYWYAFQQELFPRLEATLAPLSPRYELFVEVVEFVRLEDLLPYDAPQRIARHWLAPSLPRRSSTSRQHAP